MKKKMAVAGLVVTLLSTVLLGYEKYNSLKVESLKSESVKVTNVVDGDTFDTSNGVRVRLYGINSAEYPEGCLSREAKNRLEELVLNKEIAMTDKGKDSFGRSLEMVYIGDLLINKVLVTEGWAVYDSKVNQDNAEMLAIEKAETEAKLALRGLWSSKCSQPNKNCLIKGNFREAVKTKIYTMPDCYNYEKIIVDPAGKDKWFCSENEAIKAGFTKSKDCPGMK